MDIAGRFHRIADIVDPNRTISVGATLAKLFGGGGKKTISENENVQIPNIGTPEDSTRFSGEPNFSINSMPDYDKSFQLQKENLPIPEVNTRKMTGTFRDRFSTDNPIIKELDKPGFWVRKENPKVLALAQQWEDETNKRSIAKQMADLELATRKKQLETMGQPKPVDPLDVEYKLAQIAKLTRDANAPYSQPKEKTLVEKMNVEYDDYLKSDPVKYDSDAILINKPTDKISWIRTRYGEETARKYVAESSGNSALLNRPTTASRTGTKLGYVKNDRYTESDWWEVDSIVRKHGSFRKAAEEIISNPSLPNSYIEALAARNNMTMKEFQNWFDKYQMAKNKKSNTKNMISQR